MHKVLACILPLFKGRYEPTTEQNAMLLFNCSTNIDINLIIQRC